MKNIFKVAIACLMTTTAVHAEETLRYAHFMPAGSWMQPTLFVGWADAVEAASGGAVKTTVFPAQTLGRAPAGYDNAAMGVADIAWTVQGYTAGRFPLSQIMELPGLFETGAEGSCAFQMLYDSGALDAEYEETHVLFVHTHAPGQIFTKGKPVTRPADMAGMKFRAPTAVIANLMTELGAETIGMPAPAIYENMQRGTIDGYMLTAESADSFRLAEETDYRMPFGMYSLAFVATMNKAKYEGLSPTAKAAVDENSGMKWSMIAGQGYDTADAAAAPVLAESMEEVAISADTLPEWQAAADRATASYLTELDEKGLPGTATYEAIKGYVVECGG